MAHGIGSVGVNVCAKGGKALGFFGGTIPCVNGITRLAQPTPHRVAHQPDSKNCNVHGNKRNEKVMVVARSKLMLLCNALEASLNLLIFKKFAH
jgi:thymidine phosphorylase